jgi:hypothetical protein
MLGQGGRRPRRPELPGNGWGIVPCRPTPLRAQLDAFYFHKYGLTEEETAHVLDPKAVYDAGFPGETFRVLMENEREKYGEYRTQRLVLSYYRDWRDGAMSQFDWWVSPGAARPGPASNCSMAAHPSAGLIHTVLPLALGL